MSVMSFFCRAEGEKKGAWREAETGGCINGWAGVSKMLGRGVLVRGL